MDPALRWYPPGGGGDLTYVLITIQELTYPRAWGSVLELPVLKKKEWAIGSIIDKHTTPAFSWWRTFSATRRLLPEEVESLLVNTSHVQSSHQSHWSCFNRRSHPRILLNIVGNYFMLPQLQNLNQGFANFNVHMNHRDFSAKDGPVHWV